MTRLKWSFVKWRTRLRKQSPNKMAGNGAEASRSPIGCNLSRLVWQAFVSPDGFCGAELEMASVYWPFLGGRCSTGGLWLPAGEVMGLGTPEGWMRLPPWTLVAPQSSASLFSGSDGIWSHSLRWYLCSCWCAFFFKAGRCIMCPSCANPGGWGNMRACGDLESFAWSISQAGVSRMTTHPDLPHLYQFSGWNICPSPQCPLQLDGAADMTDTGPTQLGFMSSPSWANIQVEKSIWTDSGKLSHSASSTFRHLLWWIAGPLKWWHWFGVVWA